jgi:23S rRNA (uracil1939-C5)-methyltransferase
VHCPHFGPCGGCSLLDRPYEEELALKEAAFRRAVLARPFLREARLHPPLAASEPLFYRTSLKIPFGLRRGRASAGFYERKSHRIVHLEQCAIQDPRLTSLLLDARALAQELGVSIYDERTHRGLLRHFLARAAVGTDELLAGFVVRYERDRDLLRLSRRLFERWQPRGLMGVVENLNRERGSRVLGHESRCLVGKDGLSELQDGLAFETSLTTFVQVNPAQAARLYRAVERLLAPVAGLRVADLFAGYGPIALRLAQSGAQVLAAEHNARAVEEGRRAALANGLAERVTFAAGDAERALRSWTGGAFAAVVLDPPRRGLSRGLSSLLRQLAVPRLVLVSCYPDTFLRDLELLSPAYAARELLTVDLFPRTEHLESVALLERR